MLLVMTMLLTKVFRHGRTMKTLIMLIASIFLLVSCAAAPSKRYPLPDSDIEVKGGRIYYKGMLFAELRRIGIREGRHYNGLSIYYHVYDTEVWIFPEEGWHLYVKEDGRTYSTIPEIKSRLQQYVLAKGSVNFQEVILTRGDTNINDIAILPRIADVTISDNGKYVLYRMPDVNGYSLMKFSVEYGFSEKVY